MEVQATYDDVNLVLRLYELRREAKLREARKWLGSSFNARTMEEFATLCPRGSEADAYFRMVTGYWEMVASFITSGVLNQRHRAAVRLGEDPRPRASSAGGV